MIRKKIIIKVNADGSVKAEINGFKGAKCKEYIALLENLIEGEVYDEELTHEYYEQELNQRDNSILDLNSTK